PNLLKLRRWKEKQMPSETDVANFQATGVEDLSRHISRRKKIWVDLDNSPHVPFFRPIIEELRKRNYDVLITARNAYQVRELLERSEEHTSELQSPDHL